MIEDEKLKLIIKEKIREFNNNLSEKEIDIIMDLIFSYANLLNKFENEEAEKIINRNISILEKL